MGLLWQDVRYGVRSLTRSPGFTSAAVLSLALGIGANTAIFSLLDAVFLRPFPVDNAEQLVTVKSRSPEGDEFGLSYPDFLDYDEKQEVLSGILAHTRMPFSMSGGGYAEQVSGDIVSGNYFSLLGLSMPLGRGFVPEENDSPRAVPVVVISYALWQRHFGGDTSILETAIQINGKFFTVVGVAPRRFGGLSLGSAADIWIPRAALNSVMPGSFRDMKLSTQRGARSTTHVLGRLKSGVTLEQARTAMDTYARQLALAYPETNHGWTVLLRSLSQDRLAEDHMGAVMSFGAILLTIVVLVLFIACANVANLLLIRGLRRQRETAIRYAIGSSRSQIVRWLLTENMLLYTAGFAISIPIAAWSIGLLKMLPLFSWAALPFPVSGAAASFDVRLDHRVVAFAVLATFGLSVLFGLGPALRGSRYDVRKAIQNEAVGLSSGSSRLRTQSLLLACQVGVCVVLLMGAGLFTRTLQKAYAIDPGFRTENIVIASVNLNSMEARYDEVRGMAFYRQVLERVRALPGVRSVTWGADVPLARRRVIIQFVSDERGVVEDSDWIVTDCDVVGPDYLRTLGIALTQGRDFTLRDDANSHEVVVINETMARQYWPGADPIGQRMKVRGRSGIRTVEVVGVAQDVKQRSLRAKAETRIYLPLFQRYFPEMTLFAYVAGDPVSHMAAVKNEIEKMDAGLPLFNIKPFEEQVSIALSQQRVGAALLSVAGLLALGLAAIGVYSVTSYAASRRTREIGLRMALGAEGHHVLKLVVRQGITPVAIGLCMGLLAALASSRFLEDYLFGITPWDPVAMAATVGLLLVVGALGCYVPARRASALDPVLALRHE